MFRKPSRNLGSKRTTEVNPCCRRGLGGFRNWKMTWRQIRKIFNLGKRKTHGAEAASTEQFYKYFKKQNATPLNNILDPETNMETPQ